MKFFVFLRGFLFLFTAVFVILGTTLLVCILPMVLLLPLSHQVYREFLEQLFATWYHYMAGLVRFVLGIKLVFTGEDVPAYVTDPLDRTL